MGGNLLGAPYNTKFGRAIIPHRDDGSLTMITVEGSAYAASL
jgi:hypothetical protein